MTQKQTPSRVEIIKKERKLDAFFRVDEVTVSHEQFDGKMSHPRSVFVLDRGDAVAALLYDPERRKVIAVKQFRLPTLGKGSGNGWLVEAVAGMINRAQNGEPAEMPVDCLRREVREETGYQLAAAEPIATFFSSPGGSTERTFLFFAEVNLAAKLEEGGGVEVEGEDIEIVEYDVDEFFRKLTASEFEDAKLIIAGLWFQAKKSGHLREPGGKTV